MGSSNTSLELNFQSYGVSGQINFSVAMIWLTVSSVAYNASLFPTVELGESSNNNLKTCSGKVLLFTSGFPV